MKSLFSNLLVMTLFVCLSTKYAYSLKCYECDNFVIIGGHLYGRQNSPCLDVDSSMQSMIRLCQGDDSVCRTLRAGIFHEDEKTYDLIQRSCGKIEDVSVEKYSKGKETGLFLDGVAVSSMVCNTDLCNGAMGNTSTKTFLFISAMLSVFSFMFVY